MNAGKKISKGIGREEVQKLQNGKMMGREGRPA